ncbi:hypothetical protein TNCV_2874911 [Trichonephila clavipes]|nr:hypothetical protein TNCV_2874911 [Trichonephila clavipes]
MIPPYNKKRCAAVPFETGIHFRRKTDFFPEEDRTKSYSGFEPTRLQAEGHSHHTGWATMVSYEYQKYNKLVFVTAVTLPLTKYFVAVAKIIQESLYITS